MLGSYTAAINLPHSVFHCQLKTHLFSKLFPPLPPSLALISWITERHMFYNSLAWQLLPLVKYVSRLTCSARI